MSDSAAMAAFWNVLIPGNAGWPSATAAISDLALIAAELPADDQAWLRSASTRVLAATDRESAMQDLENAAPGAFGRMLHALYFIYYTTSAVHAVIEGIGSKAFFCEQKNQKTFQ
jgi:hypothetical protein